MPESRGGDRPGAPRRAAAVHYPGTGAPSVVASGRGLVAERILEVAREAGVPVHRDAALSEALAKLELGPEIPEALYSAVAEVLAWAYGLDLRAARGGAGSEGATPPR